MFIEKLAYNRPVDISRIQLSSGNTEISIWLSGSKKTQLGSMISELMVIKK